MIYRAFVENSGLNVGHSVFKKYLRPVMERRGQDVLSFSNDVKKAYKDSNLPPFLFVLRFQWKAERGLL